MTFRGGKALESSRGADEGGNKTECHRVYFKHPGRRRVFNRDYRKEICYLIGERKDARGRGGGGIRKLDPDQVQTEQTETWVTIHLSRMQDGSKHQVREARVLFPPATTLLIPAALWPTRAGEMSGSYP